jgi:hypothetical protein
MNISNQKLLAQDEGQKITSQLPHSFAAQRKPGRSPALLGDIPTCQTCDHFRDTTALRSEGVGRVGMRNDPRDDGGKATPGRFPLDSSHSARRMVHSQAAR